MNIPQSILHNILATKTLAVSYDKYNERVVGEREMALPPRTGSDLVLKSRRLICIEKLGTSA